MSADDKLYSVLKAAHARWSPLAAERFPTALPLGAGGADLGTAKGQEDQQLGGWVPMVPAVPTLFEKERQARSGEVAADLADWEERAAILEFETGLTRAEAEAAATAELGSPPISGLRP